MNKKQLTKYGLIALAPVFLALLILIGDTVTRIVMGLVLVTDLLYLFLLFKRERTEKTFDEILKEAKPHSESHDIFDADTIKVTGKYVPQEQQPPQKPVAPLFRQNTVTTTEAPRREKFVILSDEEPSDISERYFEIINEAAPGIENNKATISFFLDKMIKLVREGMMAHTAAFFWVNQNTRKITPAAYIVGTDDFKVAPIPLENDLLSQVVLTERPVSRESISAGDEVSLIRYYNGPHGIRSFGAVPVYFDRKVIGVMAVDSKDEDAFGPETLFAMGRYVRIITHVLSIVQTGFLEGLAEKRLKAMNGIIDQLLISNSVDDILGVFEQRLRELIPAKVIYFLDFPGTTNSLRISRVFTTEGTPYVPEGTEVEVANTLAGNQLSNPGPLYYKNVTEEGIPRFNPNEERVEAGSLLTVPLNINGQLIGILCLESPENNAFTSAESRFVARLNSLLSYVFYNYSLQMMLRNDVLYDAETRVMNKKFFMEQVDLELQRLKMNNLQGALALVSIDKAPEQMELFGSDISSKPHLRLAEYLRSEAGVEHTIGKLDKDIYGVFSFGRDAKKAYIWAEKLKSKVAKQSSTAAGGGNGFTISVGIAPAENKGSFEEIFQLALLALQKAQEGTGGKVVSST